MLVFCAPDFARSTGGVDLEDGVLLPIDLGVKTEAEEVLVVVGVNTRVDLCSPTFCVFAGCHGICI